MSNDTTAIQVEGLKKSFRIPTQRVDSLKERAVHPFASREYRELKALDGVSFEIRQGEFFGIVGRNGSGKSTLLKLLASIYRADAGTIRIAGRLAPFIELGVGFNPELSARENVVLNGVMMGLTPQQARSRLDAVVDFAELDEFVDLKLKNYSSGMLVRLAFSLLLEVDADVLLIDEVLAVGDAAFQQKCADAFREMKAEGKTIVLVTHEMATVEEYCHRAMLIDDGQIAHIGDPDEVGRRYLRLNFERAAAADASRTAGPSDGAGVSDPGRRHRRRGRQSGSARSSTATRSGSEIEIEARQDFAGLGVAYPPRQRRRRRRRHPARRRSAATIRSPVKAGERFRVETIGAEPARRRSLLRPLRHQPRAGRRDRARRPRRDRLRRLRRPGRPRARLAAAAVDDDGDRRVRESERRPRPAGPARGPGPVRAGRRPPALPRPALADRR